MALNRLVGFLLAHGAAVRVYSPVVETPAFQATGDVVAVKALPFPGRSEYRLVYHIDRSVERDVDDFAPNIVHVSAPETLGHWAVSYARRRRIPVIASVHTRFDTYLRYYHLGFLKPAINAALRRLYRRCNAIVAPSPSMADILRRERMNSDVGIWASGVDQAVFNRAARSISRRRKLGLADQDVVVGFFGRLVLEKGVETFCDVIDELARRSVLPRVLIVGEGPARARFAERLPHAVFTGFLGGADLPRAIASMDVLLNPSVTETFGIVTLEAMSCGVAVVGADSPGTSSLVVDGLNGRLVKPDDVGAFADAVAAYAADPTSRAAAGMAGISTAAGYDWNAVNAGLADTYLHLIDRYETGVSSQTGSSAQKCGAD